MAHPIRIVAAGPRWWSDPAPLVDALSRAAAHFGPGLVVVHGAARGADLMWASAARSLGLAVEAVPAAWRSCVCGLDCVANGAPYCRDAGKARNAVMLALPGVVGVLVAAPGPRDARPWWGTRDTVSKAKALGLPTWRVSEGVNPPAPLSHRIAPPPPPAPVEPSRAPVTLIVKTLLDPRCPYCSYRLDYPQPKCPGCSLRVQYAADLGYAELAEPTTPRARSHHAYADPLPPHTEYCARCSTLRVAGLPCNCPPEYVPNSHGHDELEADPDTGRLIQRYWWEEGNLQATESPQLRPWNPRGEATRHSPHTSAIIDNGPRVYSRRAGAEPIPEDAIYVGRPSAWGNPFPANQAERRGSHTPENRTKNIADFAVYAIRRAASDPDWLAPLKGKSLVCWCAPLACHADVLLKLANR